MEVLCKRFLTDSPLSNHRSWYRRFQKRQSSLLKSNAVIVGKALTDNASNREALSSFITKYSEWYSDYYTVPDDIINLDETRAELPRYISPVSSTLTRQSDKVLIDYMKSTGCVTMLPAVNAAGTVILVLFIYKHKDASVKPSVSVFVETEDQMLSRTGIHHVYSAVTSSGFMTKTLWIEVIKRTVELANLHGTREKLLLFDASTTHRHDEVSLPNTTSLMIPPGMTPFLQPLDDIPLASYKNSLRRNVARRETPTTATLPSPQGLYYDIIRACVEAFTPKIIRKSFENTGLVPFNSDKIWDRFSKKALPPRNFDLATRFADDVESKRVFLELALEQPSMTSKRTRLETTPERLTLLPSQHSRKIANPPTEGPSTKKPRPKPHSHTPSDREEDEPSTSYGRRYRKRPRLSNYTPPLTDAPLTDVEVNFATRHTQCAQCGYPMHSAQDWYTCQRCHIFALCRVCQGREKMIAEHEKSYHQ